MSTAGREFLTALDSLMESFQKDQRAVFRKLKLTPIQYFVLKWVAHNPAANMSHLAGFLGVRPQTVTPVVDALQRAGWLRRSPSTTDRRESLLQVTAGGQRLLGRLHAAYLERVGRALDAASEPDLRSATMVLGIVSAVLARAPPEGRPRVGPAASRSPGRDRAVR